MATPSSTYVTMTSKVTRVRGKPRQTRSISTRERILDAAQALFAERGFDATSTKEIADTAGVAAGLVFYYFKTKRDIFDTLIQERTLISELRDTLSAALNEDPYTTLVALGVRLQHAIKERRDLARIILQEWLATEDSSDAPPARFEVLFEQGTTLVANYLKEAVQRGKLPPVDCNALAATYISSLLFHAIFLRGTQPEAYVLATVKLLLPPNL